MAKLTVSLSVTLAWWLKPYLYGVAFFSALMGQQPDLEKVQRMVRKAMRVTVA